jgi:hypothetical protein
MPKAATTLPSYNSLMEHKAPCPYCGGKTITRVLGWEYGIGHRALLECQNPDCGKRSHTAYAPGRGRRGV